jgi:hypothetical protein
MSVNGLQVLFLLFLKIFLIYFFAQKKPPPAEADGVEVEDVFKNWRWRAILKITCIQL